MLSRWKEDRGAPGKDDRKVESPKPWQGPPAPAVMRSLPDPFAKDGPMGKLPDVVRPPTAITGMCLSESYRLFCYEGIPSIWHESSI